MNFTTGSIHRKIISFSIPLFIGSVLQQVYSISDSIIAGKLIGSEALAAISAAMPVIKVSIALTTGITLGISVVVSHLFGADDTQSIRQTIISSYIFFTLSYLLSLPEEYDMQIWNFITMYYWRNFEFYENKSECNDSDDGQNYCR